MSILDEQKLESINNILYCAIAENKRVCISYQIQSIFRMGGIMIGCRNSNNFVTIC